MTRSTRRRLTTALLVLLVVVLAAAALTPTLARAAAATVRAALSPSGGPFGSVTQVTVAGFAPAEAVSVRFDGRALPGGDAGGVTDAAGRATFAARIPRVAPGAHQLFLTGGTSGRTATAVFLVRADWPQLGGGGAHANAATGDVVRPADLRPTWSTRIGGPTGRGAAVLDGTVYAIARENRVVALDQASGAVRWDVALAGPVAGTLAVAAGRVVVVQRTGDVVALDVATGQPRWTVATGAGARVGALVSGDTAYVGSSDGRLLALDLDRGTTRWTAAGTGIVSALPVLAGAAVVTARGRQVTAVDAATGALRWTTPVAGSRVGGALSADRDSVYLTSDGFGLVRLALDSGRTVWGVRGVRAAWVPTLAVGRVWAERSTGDGGSEIVAVDTTSAAVTVNAVLPSPTTGGLTVAGASLVFTTRDGLTHVRSTLAGADGPAELWSGSTGTSAQPVTVVDGTLLLATDAGRVVRVAAR